MPALCTAYGKKIDENSFPKMIEYSVLRPDLQRGELLKCCDEARYYGFAALYVNPCWTREAAEALRDTGVEIGTPIDFPLGSATPVQKLDLAEKALEQGSAALDVVVNTAALKDRRYQVVRSEMESIAKLAHVRGAVVKPILEVCYLSDQEVADACRLLEDAGADYVKASTGTGPSGPELKHIRLIRQTVSSKVRVKVGGPGAFWTPQIALLAVLAGADRVGTRLAPWVVQEYALTAELIHAATQVLPPQEKAPVG